MIEEFYEYYCTKCHVKITTDEPGYVECPECESGNHIRDYADYEDPPFLGKDFNYNKV
jgi:Zn finger protein HypA/HybF involved in hydrogenase expression